MSTVETTTKWYLKGRGYEFCNCAPGCTCNFSGFPSSKDGSCKALVGCKALAFPGRDVHGGFRRSIEVVKLRSPECAEVISKGCRKRFSAAEYVR